MDDIRLDSFKVNVHVTLPPDVAAELERSAALREEAARARAQAAQLSRQAARHLRDHGLSLRDVGQALGVTFQRAKQLIDEADRIAS